MDVGGSRGPEGPVATRRGFMKWFTGIMISLCALLIGIPFVGSFIGPAFRKTRPGWIKLGSIAALPLGKPTHLTAPDVQIDAYIHETTVRHLWAVKRSATEVTVFSPVCPHLGCHFDWDASTGKFRCPCHGSVYSLDGKVLGGPAPRPLDTLPTKIENGELSAEWVQFKSGTPDKIAV